MSLTPSNYKNAKPFKAFIQQVLPTIYDDSLSYSELLYKVLYNMNLLVENNNLLISDIKKLYEYTNDYFENLDVQTEIDNKLEQMYQSGQLDELFKKYLDPKLAKQDEKIDNSLNYQNSKITVLESRMNEFTALKDGSTTGDAELQDIRIAYDGKKYKSAGEAVRGQVEELSYVTNKESQIILDELLLDKQIDFSENGYYKPSSDGITLDTSAGKNTGYVDVGIYKKIRYTVKGALPYIFFVAYFDKDKEFISGVKDGVESSVENESDIPHNARFVIISTFDAKFQSAFFVGTSKGVKKVVEALNIKSESLKTIGENIGLSIALENIGYYKPNSEEIVFDGDTYGRNTGLISVFGFSKIKATNVSGDANYIYPIVFFDINKVPMKEYSILKTKSDTYEADIPESAFYACVSTWSRATYNAKCILGNNEYFGKIESSLSRINFNCLEFSTFAKFGLSGDSITVGYTRNPMTEEDVGRNIYYSWGQFIARRNGNICLNFGKSGVTSKQWMADELCYNRLINPDNLCQAYVIALGANDAAQENLNEVPFGSIQDVDFSNMENNADTVYGWYARVINAHIVTAPTAKIFLITIPYWRNEDPNVQTMNNLIREMASRQEFKNVFLVDIDSDYNDYFKNGVFPDIWYAGGHYSAIGYNYYSRIHEYAISKVMKDNSDKFNDIPFIPFGSNNVLD